MLFVLLFALATRTTASARLVALVPEGYVWWSLAVETA